MDNNQNQEVVEVKGSGFAEGQQFWISSRVVGGKEILKNRIFHYTKDSKKPGMVNGHLVNQKDGKLQRTEIAIPIECLEPLVAAETQLAEAQ